MKAARKIYDRLWHEAVLCFERGEPQIDPHLGGRAGDVRRGVTLILRPQPAVQRTVNRFLRKLAVAAPGQHFYRPEEFHVTVLAIIPGSESWRERIHHLAAYQTIIDGVLKKHRKFSITFRGVTASPGAVMIQGVPKDDALAQIRADLRKTLRRHKLAEQLDVRYKINSAHITIMRFCKADADWKHLLELLKANRMTDFGETSVTRLELIFGDWYASANTVRTLQEYKLKA